MATQELRTRYSVRELQKKYEKGDKKPLEDLVRAWKGIKDLPASDTKSFFNLAGYHGEPFTGAGAFEGTYWGGYCNHGNVLFPTWHRAYVLKVEEALQSIVEGVMLPYWDETSEESLKNGIPWVLTNEKFELDGKLIDNPLRSYKFPVQVDDAIPEDNNAYTKLVDYETVRYPLSGLVGTQSAFQKTMRHNAKFPDYETNVKLLNTNIKAWLNKPEYPQSINNLFINCLEAPNYTVFSNNTSAAAYNDEKNKEKQEGVWGGAKDVIALEQPHDAVHLAVGGYDMSDGEFGEITGSNGDMGENNTASFDPIFFFHHCNVDRVFWLWQKKHGTTDNFDIISGYKGTSSTDSQGPTPGFGENAPLTMDSPLIPFMFNEQTDQRIYTSRDCINIEKQLGYTYSVGSLENLPMKRAALTDDKPPKKLQVSGINRALFKGSFVINAYALVGDRRIFLGNFPVLSRWNVTGCANCQTHLGVQTTFSLEKLNDKEIEKAKFIIDFQHRGEQVPSGLKYDLKVIE